MAHSLRLMTVPGLVYDLKIPSELRKFAGYRARAAELIVDEGSDSGAASCLLHDVNNLLDAATAAELGERIELTDDFFDVEHMARHARALAVTLEGLKDQMELGSDFSILAELASGLEHGLHALAEREQQREEVERAAGEKAVKRTRAKEVA